ncbi:hypothetical protein GP486_000473 [Trichoglossum hirsutum]|uniref:HAUS augmin-like complex subunit 3 N-terminal domain-containing protein n=1 Tax=Trichoglossum hirsutum TaxID=265104 RepID=A0A9P8RTJ5_9PEZI|nr:hypothetical protein GP486_000473 [Trichoglossum hirsutum]
MKEPSPLDQLLAVLQERDIPLARDDVEWAFQSPQTNTEVHSWVQHYFGPDTLLSKEELELFSKLEKAGISREIAINHDLSVVKPISDEEIRSAIETLEISTAAINQQNLTLKAKRDHLEAIIEESHTAESTQNRLGDRHSRKFALERQHVIVATEELTQSLMSQLALAQQQAKVTNSALIPTVTEVLKSDDRAFSRLEKLMADLACSELADGNAAVKSETLSRKLTAFNAELIKARLDRIYVQAGLTTSTESRTILEPEIHKGEIEHLLEDLESLYSEIYSVAEMSTQNQFLGPILRAISDDDILLKSVSEERMNYVSCTLEYLTKELNSIKDRIQAHRSHREAVELLSAAVKLELSDPLSQQAKRESPTRRRLSATAAKSPAREKRAKHRVSGVFGEEEENPSQQLLKSLGISLRTDCGRQDIESSLEAAVSERSSKLQSHFSSLESSTESSLAAHLGDSEKTLQLLLDTLYQDSQSNKVHLSSGGMESRIEKQERMVSEVGDGMSGLDMEVLHNRNKRRDGFVERWLEKPY